MEKEIPFHKNSQNYRLLMRLLSGPISNWQIVHQLKILKYTSRIWDIRQRRFDIICWAVPDRPGLYVYQLVK